MRGKMVPNDTVVGATIVDVGWTTIQVRTEDGNEYEIRAEEGHSGTELNVYEERSSL